MLTEKGEPITIISVRKKINLFDLVKSIITPTLTSLDAEKVTELLEDNNRIYDEKIIDTINNN